MLHYLKFGDLPRNASSGRTLLDEATLKLLKDEANFFLLPQLATLCNDRSVAPLFMVSEYHMDSDKSIGLYMRRFESYSDARAFFDTYFQHLRGDYMKVYENDETPEEEYVQYIGLSHAIDKKTGLEVFDSHESGHCKRAQGYSLQIWHNEEGEKDEGLVCNYHV